MYRQKEKVDDAYPLHRMRKKQMEHTWTKEFYQETDPAKRQQILKEHIGEEEAWEEEYRTRLWTARYGQRRLQKDEFVRCLMELKYLAEGTSLDPGGDRRKMGARILSALCLAEAMQSEEGYQKILEDELYNVFLKFIHLSGIRHGTIIRRRNREKDRRTDQRDRFQGAPPASYGKRIHPAPGSRPPGISPGVSEQRAFFEQIVTR